MKKLFAVCIIGLTLGVTGVFAQHPGGLGIGIIGSMGLGGGGAAFSLKAPSLPIYWAISLKLKGGSGAGQTSEFGFGVSGDYYFFDQALAPDIGLGWYLGGGAFVGYWSATWHSNAKDAGVDNWTYALLQLGGELPIGVSWMIPIPVKLELFLQVVPNIGAQFSVAGGDYYDGGGLWFDVGGNLGIRLWL
jgi:hypothetical protein